MVGLKKYKKNSFNMNKLSSKLQKIKKISQQNQNYQACILTKLSSGFNKIKTQEIKNKKINRIILDFKSIMHRIFTGTRRKIRANISI